MKKQSQHLPPTLRNLKGDLPDVDDAPPPRPVRSPLPQRARLLTTGVVAVALTASLGWLVSSLQPGDTTQTTTPAAEPTGSAALGAVPDDQINRIHTALHDIGARCGPAAADPTTQHQLAADVETIVTFAERYPDAQFTIDDETGRSLSLLLVARDELRICAPAASTRADLALPPMYRESANPTVSPTT